MHADLPTDASLHRRTTRPNKLSCFSRPGTRSSSPAKFLECNGRNENTSEPELVRMVRKYVSLNGLELCPEGVGGTYFIHDEKMHKIAVFKPSDEEPGSIYNPKKLLSKPLLPPGGGAVRELATFLLDRGFAGVPETHHMDRVSHKTFCNGGERLLPKSGSVQKYVPNLGDATSMGATRFLVSDVHKIGILDLRIFNMDRTGENILVRKDRKNNFRLVPIDHAYSLPDKLDNAWFDWLFWPQAKKNFSKKLLEKIRAINIDSDSEILRGVGIPEKNIRTMRVSTLFLKKGAAVGWTLFEIAKKVCRRIPTEESVLEKLVNLAEQTENFEMEFGIILDQFFRGEKLPGIILDEENK